MKKFISLLFVCLLFQSFAFAAVGPQTQLSVDKFGLSASKEISTRVVTACPYGNGICDARQRGSGSLYVNGTMIFINKWCFQCTKCFTVYVTQYNPLVVGTIGKWASGAYSEPISEYGARLDAPYYQTTTAATIPGIVFNR